ncbi:hypothetical protein PENSUB_12765 [Penicillium subrubescens]|uniref:Centrosomin N-terminal motif 1 domain-containing protein n=2 Tax=Penicillium subrubescens TaxID=1316194 RepID=A0A1Q5SXV9_9EURO|nr:hypothetical protein PENSUB_12765 [Penicillium subrubescens]
MNKLNFDLKLEIHHRSEQMRQMREKVQRMEAMEAELQRMHKLEEEVVELRNVGKKNQRLREENELLSQELEKRNVAVTEAVQLICQLEAKIDELESGGRTSQMSMSRLVLDGPSASTPRGQIAFEIPERTSSKRNSAALTRSLQSRSAELHQLTKAPSFLRTENQSTATLRSLYAPENNISQSAMSALTKSESFNTLNGSPESPRLSVLSECSELNPMGSASEWDECDQLDIPVRRASSTISSVDSYVPHTEREESKDYQIDRWMGSQPDACDTIIRRRQNRAMAVASHSVGPTFGGELYSKKSTRGRPPLDALFGGARLPPTPDTMSTAGPPVNNGSNGSIAAQRSPSRGQGQWFAGRPVERHRSAGELTSRRSFNEGESVQTNCSDTPRLGTTNPCSPTFLPYINVANKASELLGPGSPNHPSSQYLGDPFHQISNEDEMPSTTIHHETPTKPRPKSVSPDFERSDRWESPSPPLTPTDWVAAAKQGPRSRKDPNPPRTISQAAFHDDQSVSSFPTEPDTPRIPTLDMNTLDILEHDFAKMPMTEGAKLESEPEPAPDTRRRISFRPRLFHRNNNTKHTQSSPIANAIDDDDEEGAPSPIIPKTRTVGNARRRPVSQIITNSADTYSSSLPNSHSLGTPFEGKSLHQSLMESRSTAISMNGAATISDRPTTSHSTDTHKRRSSLSIFGWVKGMAGKRSEPATPVKAEKGKAKENDPSAWSVQDELARSETSDSFDAPVVRPRSEMTMHSDDQGRRPRYVSRHSRRV